MVIVWIEQATELLIFCFVSLDPLFMFIHVFNP